MSTLAAGTMLAERGYAVHWLRHRSKVPIGEGWSTAPIADLPELRRSYQPNHNIGVRCGHWSNPQPECGLVVVDIDIKGPEAHCEPFEVLGKLYDGPVVDVLSGSGLGRHWWFACPYTDLPPRANTTIAKSPHEVIVNGHKVPEWAIEILSTGKQVAVPSSMHPSGKVYKWLTPLPTTLPELPASILEAVYAQQPAPSAPKEPQRHRNGGDSIADAFNAAVSWSDILAPHGWQFVRQHGERLHWCRPGKNPRDGISATTTGDVFYCFSSSTVFDVERGYSKFATYAVLEHHGDMRQAARELCATQNGGAA